MLGVECQNQYHSVPRSRTDRNAESAGLVEYGDITLRYGVTTSKALWEWFMKGAEGKVDGLRRNVTIELLKSDRSGEAVRWNLFDAWISEWRGARLDAMGKEIAIESITLVFDKLERA